MAGRYDAGAPVSTKRLVERELPELSSCRLGSHEVALLHRALEVSAEGCDLRPTN